jgi:peptidoglycan/LPS O-acetylase OafA/YrhL
MSDKINVEKLSGYRPEIDGLRAIAVIAVVMFHLGLGCPGGFVGVDIFFVISGFLITGIVQRRIENKTFSFEDFFSRRIRRIFPALAVMIITSIAAGYLILLPEDLAELGKSSVAQALFVANFYFASDTGYFAGPAELKPLLHTWSLAVEEQFYFIFPILLLILQRLNRGRLVLLLAVAFLISFSASIYGLYVFPTATFFLLPTRAWELLTGCLLALSPWKHNSSDFRDNVIAALGLFVVIVPILLMTVRHLFLVQWLFRPYSVQP